MNTRVRLSLILALVAMACHKKQDEESSRAIGSTVQPPTLTAPERGASRVQEPSESDIDLPEDFADDAKEEITAANVAEQLGRIEKEIEISERKP